MPGLTEAAGAAITRLVVDVPDFPEPGVVFKDISPLLGDAQGLADVIGAMAEIGRGWGAIDRVVGMESRGFIVGAPVALKLGVGFVPVRKPGKLPRAVRSVSYSLEYGEATLQIQEDAIAPGERILLVDDVLATGGTAAATRHLVESCGGVVVGMVALMELSFLGGREAIGDLPFVALHIV